MPEVAVAILALSGLVLAALIAVRVREQTHLDSWRTWYKLRFPRDLSPDAVRAFLYGVSGALPRGRQGLLGLPAVVFEVRADGSGISHWLGVPQPFADYTLGQLRASIPSVRVDQGIRPRLEPRRSLEFRLSRGHVPLRVEHSSAVAASLLACLQPLATREAIVVQWVVSPSLIRRTSDSSSGIPGPLDGLFSARRPERIRSDELAKLAEPLFECVGRAGVAASSDQTSRRLLRRVLSGIYARRTLEARLQPRLIPGSWAARRLKSATVPLFAFPALLNAAELAALAAFPMDSPVLPGLVLGGARELPAPVDVPATGLVLGVGTHPGAERPVAISEADASRHLLVVGPTGAGKSSLLNSLAVDRMRAGAGLLLIDPAGDLAARVIDSVPEGRESDVIVIDPADIEFPVALNLLAVSNRSADLVVDDFVAVVRRAWGEHLVGPRSEDILRMACTTLVTQPEPVLTDLPRLLVDKAFRRRFVAGLDDPIALQPFWGWFESLTITKRADVVGPISNKLRSFYRPLLRNIIGQVEPSFSMAEAMQEGKIIICSLARGAMGEGAASFFGAMVMALWAQAVQSRVNIPPSDRRPFYALVDEYQTLLGFSSPVDEILAQARKFNAALAIATQSLSTLPSELKQASLINTRSKVVFQTGAADAPLLAKEFAPHLTADDLRGLEAFHAYAAVSTGSMTSPPISIRTLPPPPALGSAERVRQLSRDQYARPRADVERAIRERHTDKAPAAPVGRKPR